MDKNLIAVTTYEKIADVYTKLYFEDLTDSRYIDIFLDRLPDQGKVLDVGSGPGQFSQYMHQKGYQVVGVELSKKMLEIAELRVPSVVFHQMDMRHLTFENAYFDGLLVAYSLIHIPSQEIPRTLQGFSRILKHGGYIELIAQQGESDMVIDEPFMPSQKMFFNFFTKEKLIDYLTNAGFQITYQIEIDSQDPDSVSNRIIYTIAQKIR